MVMKAWILALCLATAALAADEQQLALSLKAQSDFDRVELAASPQLRETINCVQSQATLLAVATAEEAPLLHFRRGYCALAGATITHSATEYAAAAAAFEKAIETWPARAGAGKKITPEPVSSALSVLASISRLQRNPDSAALASAQASITAALQANLCPSSVMPVTFCQNVLHTGHLWLGWMALQRDDLSAAAREFAGGPGSGWLEWTDGRRSFQSGAYSAAVSEYRRAIDFWESHRNDEQLTVLQRVAPRPVMTDAYTDLGGAQLAAGDPANAIRGLNQAIKESASNARAYYLRARAREAAGQGDAALADYNLASRTAFANSENLNSGEAHLYRGIAMYRRKDYPDAEEEFSNALNFKVTPAVRADAMAWRHMAAAASGACDASRQLLEKSVAETSPYFPKDEARSVISSCTASTALRGE